MRWGYPVAMADQTDPDGYTTALETIELGALSERDQRIAAALAMVREGRSVAGAARATQVPRTTLSRYVAGVSRLGSTNGIAPRVRDLVDVSYDVARIAGEAVRESLSERPEDWKPGDLVKAFGVATDKTIALAGQRSEGERGVSALAELLSGGGSLTIQTPTPDERAVEVDGRRVEE